MNFGGRAIGDLATEVERHDLIGDAHHQAYMVLDQQKGEGEMVADVADQLTKFAEIGLAETSRWFIEQQQLWFASRARANSTRLHTEKGTSFTGKCAIAVSSSISSRPVTRSFRNRSSRSTIGRRNELARNPLRP